MAKKQKVSKHKYAGRNQGPARQRYWREGRLAKHKVRNLVRYNGLTESEAYVLWMNSRTTRFKK
jgi:hypothetical protein